MPVQFTVIAAHTYKHRAGSEFFARINYKPRYFDISALDDFVFHTPQYIKQQHPITPIIISIIIVLRIRNKIKH
jgi:hypothetical protein